jgi:hypothetical protein
MSCFCFVYYKTLEEEGEEDDKEVERKELAYNFVIGSYGDAGVLIFKLKQSLGIMQVSCFNFYRASNASM